MSASQLTNALANKAVLQYLQMPLTHQVHSMKWLTTMETEGL